MFFQIFNIVSPLLIVAIVGYVYGVRVKPEMGITNRLVMDVFVPALILEVMLQEGFRAFDYAGLVVAASLLMVMSGIVAFVVSRLLNYSWRSFTPPAMFSNWANLGLPLYVFSLGEQALNGGIMLVVLGNMLCFSLGVYIYSGRLRLVDVFKTPVVIAVVVGLLLNHFGVTVPTFIQIPLSMLGQVAIPLMLFALGVRLTKVTLNDTSQGLLMGVLCPLVGVAAALVLVKLIPMTPLQQQILILFGALPPAVVNFMLAEQYSRDAEKVASMVMLGNLMSLISIPIVLYFFILS